jgi:hypothetical protein
VRRVVLTGEVKMPDTPQGRSPFHQELVEDAFDKASRTGTPYYFTWNVCDFVLFETHREGVAFMDRRVEGPVWVVDIVSSEDVRQASVEQAIKDFWERFLGELAAIEAGRRPLRNLPLDRRFVLRLEAALEEPIAATRQEIARGHQSDSGFRGQLTRWMVSDQGWEDSSSPEVLNENLDRAARLSCYVLMMRLVFYEVLRRRFPVMAALGGMAPRDPEELSQILDSRFSEAVDYSRDYETIFLPKDFGTGLPFLAPEAPRLWRSVVERIEEFDFSSGFRCHRAVVRTTHRP